MKDNNDDYDWSREKAHTCAVCGHIQYNEDKEENKFILFTEKLHTEDYGRIIEWSQSMCPKCNHLFISRW